MLWSAASRLLPRAGNTNISLSQAAFSSRLLMSLCTKLSLYSLAGFPDFSSHQHNEKISSSPLVVVFIFSGYDKTHHQLLSGVIKQHSSKVIRMADVHPVNFLRLEIPASVLLTVSGPYVFKSWFDLSLSGTFSP